MGSLATKSLAEATKSLAEARVDAVNLRARARAGEDVVAGRRAKKQAEPRENSLPTFETIATEVHQNLSPTFHSETHACNWLQSLKTYVIPIFGNKIVDRIDLPT